MGMFKRVSGSIVTSGVATNLGDDFFVPVVATDPTADSGIRLWFNETSGMLKARLDDGSVWESEMTLDETPDYREPEVYSTSTEDVAAWLSTTSEDYPESDIYGNPLSDYAILLVSDDSNNVSIFKNWAKEEIGTVTGTPKHMQTFAVNSYGLNMPVFNADGNDEIPAYVYGNGWFVPNTVGSMIGGGWGYGWGWARVGMSLMRFAGPMDKVFFNEFSIEDGQDFMIDFYVSLDDWTKEGVVLMGTNDPRAWNDLGGWAISTRRFYNSNAGSGDIFVVFEVIGNYGATVACRNIYADVDLIQNPEFKWKYIRVARQNGILTIFLDNQFDTYSRSFGYGCPPPSVHFNGEIKRRDNAGRTCIGSGSESMHAVECQMQLVRLRYGCDAAFDITHNGLWNDSPGQRWYHPSSSNYTMIFSSLEDPNFIQWVLDNGDLHYRTYPVILGGANDEPDTPAIGVEVYVDPIIIAFDEQEGDIDFYNICDFAMPIDVHGNAHHTTDSAYMRDTVLSIPDTESYLSFSSFDVIIGEGFDINFWINPGETLGYFMGTKPEANSDLGWSFYLALHQAASGPKMRIGFIANGQNVFYDADYEDWELVDGRRGWHFVRLTRTFFGENADGKYRIAHFPTLVIVVDGKSAWGNEEELMSYFYSDSSIYVERSAIVSGTPSMPIMVGRASPEQDSVPALFAELYYGHDFLEAPATIIDIPATPYTGIRNTLEQVQPTTTESEDDIEIINSWLLFHCDGPDGYPASTLEGSSLNGVTAVQVSNEVNQGGDNLFNRFSNAYAKFGETSIQFMPDHTGVFNEHLFAVTDGYIYYPFYAPLGQDFTIDMWVLVNHDPATTPETRYLCGGYKQSAGNGWRFGITTDSLAETTSIHFEIISSTESASLVVADALNKFDHDVWHHVAAVRSAGQIRIYLDGVCQTGLTTATFLAYNGPLEGDYLYIGHWRMGEQAARWDDFIDEIHFSFRAEWTEEFTPPVEPWGGAIATTSSTSTEEFEESSTTTEEEIIYPVLSADDFESLVTGPLDGQAGWETNSPFGLNYDYELITITGNRLDENNNSILIQAFPDQYLEAIKYFAYKDSGLVMFPIVFSKGKGFAGFKIGFYERNSEKFAFVIGNERLENESVIPQFGYKYGSSYVLSAAMSPSELVEYEVSIEWRTTPTKSFRILVDGNILVNWKTVNIDWGTGINNFRIILDCRDFTEYLGKAWISEYGVV